MYILYTNLSKSSLSFFKFFLFTDHCRFELLQNFWRVDLHAPHSGHDDVLWPAAHTFHAGSNLRSKSSRPARASSTHALCHILVSSCRGQHEVSPTHSWLSTVSRESTRRHWPQQTVVFFRWRVTIEGRWCWLPMPSLSRHRLTAAWQSRQKRDTDSKVHGVTATMSEA